MRTLLLAFILNSFWLSLAAQDEKLTFKAGNSGQKDYSLIPVQNLIISLIECHGCNLGEALTQNEIVSDDPHLFLKYVRLVEEKGLSKARINAYREKMRIRYKEIHADKTLVLSGTKPWSEKKFIDHYTGTYNEMYKSRAAIIGDSLIVYYPGAAIPSPIINQKPSFWERLFQWNQKVGP